MALVKRAKTLHTHFFVDGQRYRQSLETSDWREAQKREKERIAQATEGKLAPASQQFSRLSMNEALDRYLADRAARVATRSHRSESDHAKPLRTFFALTPLNRISAEVILAYIRERKGKGISNTTVNMEMGVLRRVLKRAKRWHFVADEVPHLPERKDVGRALAPDEKLRLLRVAASRPDFPTLKEPANLTPPSPCQAGAPHGERSLRPFTVQPAAHSKPQQLLVATRNARPTSPKSRAPRPGCAFTISVTMQSPS